MLTRRDFVVAGGLALAGHLVPSLRRSAPAGPAVEIAMRAADGGARVWFDPLGLRVPAGTTVRWVLVEGVHTTTAYHPANGDLPRRMPEGVRPWDSGYLTEAGATHEVALEVEGVYDFFCRPHEAAGMVGRIVVVPEAGAREDGATDAGAPTPGAAAASEDVSPAAAEAFPAVDRILREGRVRAEPG